MAGSKREAISARAVDVDASTTRAAERASERTAANDTQRLEGRELTAAVDALRVRFSHRD